MPGNLPAPAKSPAAGQAQRAELSPPPPDQYLIFSLYGETYAIDIHGVREIIEYGEVTEVPMMPPTIRGVINLRGAVVPVIDLAARFGRESRAAARRSCFVIIEAAGEKGEGGGEGTQTLGIVVDAVNEVVDISAADIEPAPSFGAHLRTDFIAGMARQAGRFIVILDLSSVLALDELANLGDSLPASLESTG